MSLTKVCIDNCYRYRKDLLDSFIKQYNKELKYCVRAECKLLNYKIYPKDYNDKDISINIIENDEYDDDEKLYIISLIYNVSNAKLWSDNIILNNAVEHNQFNILLFLHKNGCFLEEITFNNAIISGNLDMIKYLYIANCPYHEHTSCIYAAENNYLEVCKYLKEISFKFDVGTTIAAAYSGKLDCLKFAIDNGCPINEEVFYRAVEGNHINVVKYLVELYKSQQINYTDDDEICRKAVDIDNLEMLIYLHKNGYKISYSSLLLIIYHDDITMLKYVLNINIDNHKLIMYAIKHNSQKCLRYLKQKSCYY